MKKRDSELIDLLLEGIGVVLLLPVVGLYLMSLEEVKQQNLGKVLFIIGLILWIFFILIRASK